MRIEFERKTISNDAVFEGQGIHSGTECRVVVRSGTAGIVFVRDGVRTLALPDNVTDTTRSTTLGNVRMVEHLMSALAGAEITDAEVEVIGSEMPILDGSSKEYLAGLQTAGASKLGARRSCRLFGRVNLNEGDRRIGISVGSGRWRYEFERLGHWPGCQIAEAYLEGDSYETRVSPARTFAFEDEIQHLLAAGLGQGGSSENTIVIGPHGYLTESRYPDEPARHKLLDCIGDIALCGIPPRFLNVVAEHTGHTMHVKAAARLMQICTWEE